MYAQPQKSFGIIGYYTLPAKISSICLSTTQKIPSKFSIFAISPTGIVLAIIAPSIENGFENKKFEAEDCVIYARKVDTDLFKIAVHDTTGDVYLTGKDKLDPRIKAPPNPNDEQYGHPLSTNSITTALGKFLVTGGQDGSIFLRDMNELSRYKEVWI